MLAPHVAAAAQEHPVTLDDTRYFGDTLPALVEGLTAAGHLRRAGLGLVLDPRDRAVDVDRPAFGQRPLGRGGRGLDRPGRRPDGPAAADRTVLEGAVYLHQGEQWRVIGYDWDPGRPRRAGEGRLLHPTAGECGRAGDRRAASHRFGPGRIRFGSVELPAR